MKKLFLLLFLSLSWPAAAEETRLVRVEKDALGTRVAIEPEFDYTVAYRRVFDLDDSQKLLANFGSGLVRVRGEFSRGRIKVNPLAVYARAVLGKAWRGRLSANPRGEQVFLPELGRAAALRLETEQQRTAWQQFRNISEFELLANFVEEGSNLVALDPRFLERPAGPSLLRSVSLYGQLSETFLDHCAAEFVYGHRQLMGWTDPNGAGSFRIDRLGLTLLGAEPGQVRLYGSLEGKLAGVPLLEAWFEAPARVSLEQGEMHLTLVKQPLKVEVARPWRWQMPADWSLALAKMLEQTVGRSLVLPVPKAYEKELTEGGALTPEQVAGFELITLPAGDRRRNRILLAAPGQRRLDIGAAMLPEGAEFLLAFTPEALNRAMARQLQGRLPTTIDIPRELEPKQKVFLFTLRFGKVTIRELGLAYRAGRLFFEGATFDVHWDVGPFKGVEPGARLWGSLQPLAQSRNPLVLAVKGQLDRVEFLSPEVRKKSQREQDEVRRKLEQAISQTPLTLPLPPRLPVPPLSGRAGLELVDMQALDEQLVLFGRLLP